MNRDEVNLSTLAAQIRGDEEELWNKREELSRNLLFAGEVWEKLSRIDCGKHTEKRGQFTYLSWSWAWATLMQHYPASSYYFFEPGGINDTVEVRCDVTVRGEHGSVTREMWLPVMDNRNNAIKNPDSRAVSDAKMRCLVKCLAMFGLGHYIYAGEDLPPNEPSVAECIAAIGRAATVTALKDAFKSAYAMHGDNAEIAAAKDKRKEELSK